MAKKQSESSPPARRIQKSAKSIWTKPLTKRQKETLDAIAAKQARGDLDDIDYSDIPPLTDAQLKAAKRPSKKLVAVRLDADVFEWLQKFGRGYSTRINSVLRAVMSQPR